MIDDDILCMLLAAFAVACVLGFAYLGFTHDQYIEKIQKEQRQELKELGKIEEYKECMYYGEGYHKFCYDMAKL